MITGHRGARAEAPENTLDGFAHAAAIGLASVEFDVRMTSDEQLVVIHDATVDRTTDGSGPVSGFTSADLAGLDAAAVLPGHPRKCLVPSLADVLEATADFDQFELEIKLDSAGRTEQVVRDTLAELARHDRTNAVVLTSFHPFALETAAKLAPHLRRGLIGDWPSADTIDQALALGATRACLHQRTSSAEICAAARRAGLEVIGWPCENDEDWDRCRSWGVDGITTDHPTAMLRQLAP